MLSIRIAIPLTLPKQAAAGIARQAFNAGVKNGTVRNAVVKVLEATVLREYRKLFLQALPELLTPVLRTKSGKKAKRQVGSLTFSVQDQQQYLRALEMLDRASPAQREKANATLERLQRKLTRQMEARSDRRLSTGMYQQRLRKVLQLLTDPEQIGIWLRDDGNLGYGIGRRKDLDLIKVPSFMAYGRGAGADPNRKPRRGSARVYLTVVMWRQMEFGAGAYYQGPGGKRSAQGWDFGPLGVYGIKGVRGFPALEQMMVRIQPDLQRAVQQALGV